MTTKFTPGPWFFVPSLPEEGFECFWIVRKSNAKHVTSIDGPQNEEMEANARLIAAAPDLLAVLDHASHINGFREFNDYLPTIRAAIAKATGEQA